MRNVILAIVAITAGATSTYGLGSAIRSEESPTLTPSMAIIGCLKTDNSTPGSVLSANCTEDGNAVVVRSTMAVTANKFSVGGNAMGVSTFAVSNGSVTIGNIAAPKAMLHIGDAVTPADAYAASKKIIVSGAGVGQGVLSANLTSGNQACMESGAGVSYFGSCTAHPVGFVSNLSEKMRLTTGGKVGIATTQPEATFHVAGGSIAATGANSAIWTDGGLIVYGTATFASGVESSYINAGVLGSGVVAQAAYAEGIKPGTIQGGVSLPAAGIAAGNLGSGVWLNSNVRGYQIDGSTYTSGLGEKNTFTSSKTFTSNVDIQAGSTLTVSGNAFSVGGSTFVVSLGSASIGAATGFVNALSVNGKVGIGTYYDDAAPENGLIIGGGNVGIGVSNPTFKLQVSGRVSIPAGTAGASNDAGLLLLGKGVGSQLYFGGDGGYWGCVYKEGSGGDEYGLGQCANLDNSLAPAKRLLAWNATSVTIPDTSSFTVTGAADFKSWLRPAIKSMAELEAITPLAGDIYGCSNCLNAVHVVVGTTTLSGFDSFTGGVAWH